MNELEAWSRDSVESALRHFEVGSSFSGLYLVRSEALRGEVAYADIGKLVLFRGFRFVFHINHSILP